jgi:CBS domain-containing protein
VVAGQPMTAPAITLLPTATIAEAARLLHDAGVQRLPVVDETDRLTFDLHDGDDGTEPGRRAAWLVGRGVGGPPDH